MSARIGRRSVLKGSLVLAFALAAPGSAGGAQRQKKLPGDLGTVTC